MEDAVLVDFHERGSSYYLVLALFDGHRGRDAVCFARNYLWENIKEQHGFFAREPAMVMAAIKRGFLVTQADMEEVRSEWSRSASGRPSSAGTTVALVIIHEKNVYVAHVGDSRIIAGVRKTDSESEPRVLTVDHKPSNRWEAKRIETLGGKVLADRHGTPRVARTIGKQQVPCLAVARSLGDLWSYKPEHDEYLVSPEPDVAHHVIEAGFHRFLVIASDGLWDVMCVHDVVRQVDQYLQGTGPRTSVAKGLVKTALSRWRALHKRADNTTAIVCYPERRDPTIREDQNCGNKRLRVDQKE